MRGGERADYWLNGRMEAVKGFRDTVCVVWTGAGRTCGVMMEILHSLKTSPLTFSSTGPWISLNILPTWKWMSAYYICGNITGPPLHRCVCCAVHASITVVCLYFLRHPRAFMLSNNNISVCVWNEAEIIFISMYCCQVCSQLTDPQLQLHTHTATRIWAWQEALRPQSW